MVPTSRLPNSGMRLSSSSNRADGNMRAREGWVARIVAGKVFMREYGRTPVTAPASAVKKLSLDPSNPALQFSFQQDQHFVRGVSGAVADIAGPQANFRRTLQEPVQLVVREVVEYSHAAKLIL